MSVRKSSSETPASLKPTCKQFNIARIRGFIKNCDCFENDRIDRSTDERLLPAEFVSEKWVEKDCVNSAARVSYFFGIQFHIPPVAKKRKLRLLSSERKSVVEKKGMAGGWGQNVGVALGDPRETQCLRSHRFNYFAFFLAAFRLSRNPVLDAGKKAFFIAGSPLTARRFRLTRVTS